ncbi:EAL domain-containing protein [Alcaligenes parafaecalis]|uniref:EAL domain-containing protein n=1 Tax=Alcaligenes parafaecalis TaxID=171260 RepID=A0ABT3VPH8_9BURK|nr:EAL domain-containing protein [Alcaligenes parafaecalis]MCX5465442.1 EAL domain-containing protein [Alcaligenes parafaecalis]
MEHARCVLIVLEEGEGLHYWQEQLRVFGTKTSVVRSLEKVADARQTQADMLLFPVEAGYVPLMVAKLRNDFGSLGIVAVQSGLSASARVQLLLTGADACLALDVQVPELMAWCHAVRRRNVYAAVGSIQAVEEVQDHGGQQEWVLRDKGWTLVAPNGVGLELTHSERQLMDAFVRHADARFSREDLMRDKGLAASDSRAVDSLISRLRRKASQAGVALPIKSVHGWGYTFTGKLLAQQESLDSEVMEFYTPRDELESPQPTPLELLHALETLDVLDPQASEALSFSYQLRVATSTGQYSGVDAQVFWTSPTGLRLSSELVLRHMPDPIHRQALCEWMLRTLLADVRRWWQEYSLRASHIGLKLPIDMLLPIYKRMPSLLRQFELQPCCLELDLFSDEDLEETPELIQALQYLQDHDIQVWLTSTEIENNKLNHLRGWPISGVKLEAEVIQRACREATFKALLETACHLLSEQGFELVIKGVDNLEQRDLALNLELGHYQGRLTSELMSEDGFLLTLASSEPSFGQSHDSSRRLSSSVL